MLNGIVETREILNDCIVERTGGAGRRLRRGHRVASMPALDARCLRTWSTCFNQPASLCVCGAMWILSTVSATGLSVALRWRAATAATASSATVRNGVDMR